MTPGSVLVLRCSSRTLEIGFEGAGLNPIRSFDLVPVLLAALCPFRGEGCADVGLCGDISEIGWRLEWAINTSKGQRFTYELFVLL